VDPEWRKKSPSRTQATHGAGSGRRELEGWRPAVEVVASGLSFESVDPFSDHWWRYPRGLLLVGTVSSNPDRVDGKTLRSMAVWPKRGALVSTAVQAAGL